MGTRLLVVIARVILFFLGVWLILGSFFIRFGTVQSHANEVFVGFFTMIFAMYRIGHASEQSDWISWINIVLGAWLIASPFVYGYSDLSGPTLNEIIVGIIMIVTAVVSALGSRQRQPAHH